MTQRKDTVDSNISDKELRGHIKKHNHELGAVLTSINLIDKHMLCMDRKNSRAHNIIFGKIDKIEDTCATNKISIRWLGDLLRDYKKFKYKRYGLMLAALGTIITLLTWVLKTFVLL